MEVITKFKAVDGKEFIHQHECMAYEVLIMQVDKIMSVLPYIPKDCDFANGDGYIQHDTKQLRVVEIEILKLCKKHIKHHWIQQSIDNELMHKSYVGRLLGDYDIRPLNNAWYRLMCIDKMGREWGQAYYANNPTAGQQIQLNK